MSVDTTLKLAKRRVEAIKGFYIHFGIFALVICGLLAINMSTGPDWWVQWPFLGWGAGVLAHGLGVFGGSHNLIANWEAKKIASEKSRLDKISSKRPPE